VRVYAAMFSAGVRRFSGYRAATVAGTFTNSVFGLLKANIYVAAVASAGSQIGGYDARASITYAWLTQALIAPVHLFGWNELALRVRTGDIAIDLARPVDLQLSWLAADLGRAAYVLLPRGLPPLLVAAALTGLALPAAVLPYLLGLVAVLLAVSLSFCCRFALNLCAFWLVEIRGPLLLYLTASGFLSGLMLPVPWFPGWLHRVALLTPFPSFLQYPVDLLTGRATGWAAAGQLAQQAGWLVAAALLGRWMLARATRKLVVQGG
jgi:ABC-2 type transport system permease protein